MIKKYFIEHQLLGRVILSVNSNSRSFTARWKADEVNLSVPVGTTREKVLEVLDEMAPKLLSRRPCDIYSIGMTISVPGLEVELARQHIKPQHLLINYATDQEPKVKLLLGGDVDITSAVGKDLVTRGLKTVANYYAPSLLLPRAQEIASSLGVKVKGWSIGRGDRRLGCCNSNGEISLSRICVYLNQELRDYVVCHELAHISEMNHSQRFHDICNRYLDGRERELEHLLKTYPWPIMR